MNRICKLKSGALCSFGAAVLVLAGNAYGQRSIDDSRRNAIVRAIERAAPSVVTINAIDIRRERLIDPFARDFFRFFDSPFSRSRVRERQIEGMGTGFFFDDRGHVLTNFHVVENADVVTVTVPHSGETVEAKVIGADPRSDIAVLRAQSGNQIPAILGDSGDLLIGEWVIAFGNPFGALLADAQPTVSVGVVSANHRRISPSVGRGERLYQDMIQTDAAINPGNSGGPLVDSRGQVIGINTFIFSGSGGSVGLGFAIPINRAKRVAEEIIQYGRRRDPFPGFTVVQTERGPMVHELFRNTPAFEQGLQPGDMIIAINGQEIRHTSDVDFAFWGLFVGDTATLDLESGPRQTRKKITFPIRELRR